MYFFSPFFLSGKNFIFSTFNQWIEDPQNSNFNFQVETFKTKNKNSKEIEKKIEK